MEAVIFIGIQGTGKSSFYQERFFHTHVRLNLDISTTRKRLKIDLELPMRDEYGSLVRTLMEDALSERA